MDSLFLCPTDILYRELPDGTAVIQTADREVQLRGQGIRELFTEILPRLDGHTPFVDAIPVAMQNDLQAMAPSLVKMKLLFELDAEVARQLQQESDAAFYTYLARRFENPVALFAKLKRQPIWVGGTPTLIEPLLHVLNGQSYGQAVRKTWADFIQAEAGNAAEGQPIWVTVHAETDAHLKPLLRALNEASVAQGICWVPIVYAAERVTLGPWVYPQESACFNCSDADLHQAAPWQAEQGVEEPRISSWHSLQPGVPYWVSGMFSQYLLQVLTKMSEHTLWGRTIELEVLNMTQKKQRIWKQPACPTCAPKLPPKQRWMEV